MERDANFANKTKFSLRFSPAGVSESGSGNRYFEILEELERGGDPRGELTLDQQMRS